MIPIPAPVSPPKIQRSSSQNWLEGLVTYYGDGRLPSGGLTEADNVLITQNGVLENIMGEELVFRASGDILGEVFQAKRLDGSLYLIFAFDAGDGTASIATFEEGSDIEVVATGNPKGYYCFKQIAYKILIMNDVVGDEGDTTGYEAFYYDPNTNSIVEWEQIDDPDVAPTLTLAGGLTSTSSVQRIQYAFTYTNTGGETLPSPIATQSVNVLRSQWTGGQGITVSRSATTDTDATGWNVYVSFSDDEAADIPITEMRLVATGLPIESLEWTDDNTNGVQAEITTPQDNSTAGIPAWTGSVVNGRCWLIGKGKHRYDIYRGGDAGHELDFSRRNGGGRQEINSGTEYVPQYIGGFRDGQGNMAITVLSDGIGGIGRRNNLSMRQISVGNSQIVVWESVEQSGVDGTSSPYGVASYDNSLFYPSKDGFKTTTTRAQIQNVLSTGRITDNIKDKVNFVKNEYHQKITCATIDGRIYWNVPFANNLPNQIWVFDTNHNGAWTMFIPFPSTTLTQYRTKSSENSLAFTRGSGFYILNNNLYRPASRVQSGLNKISEDTMIWARVIQVPFIMLLIEGEVTVGVIAHTQDGNREFSRTISATTSDIPIRPVRPWSYPVGWSTGSFSEGIRPVARSSGWLEFIVEVDEDVDYWQYYVRTAAGKNRYQLSQVTSEHVEIGLYNLTN